ncbi:hypothetical protein QQF64_019109 [Cirrhinus molitorella]|uniref:Uncharacterized protein n=1 Tax=Cirrhinus molitorella TaxID=172907 RepID=A0ABR3LII5_9TELE
MYIRGEFEHVDAVTTFIYALWKAQNFSSTDSQTPWASSFISSTQGVALKRNVSPSCLILSAYCYISSQSALLRPINQATRQTGAFNELIKVWIGARLVSLRFLLKGRKICSSSPCQEGSVGNHPTLLFPSELQQYGINQGFHTSCSHGAYINHRLMDALWLKEKGLPFPPYAQSFTPLQLALISSPYLRSLAGN